MQMNSAEKRGQYSHTDSQNQLDQMVFLSQQSNETASEILTDFQITHPRSKNKQPYQEIYVQKFDLATFKTILCDQDHPPSDRKHCPYYHDENDKRRNPNQFIYKCIFCTNGKKCSMGDNCQLSHNKVEQLYHPNRYKTKYCTGKEEKCEYGRYCSFAHSNDEILLPQKLHLMVQDKNFWINAYKTVWCPYINEHDRGSCVYAHNAQDFRRDPNIYLYEPFDCPNWNKSTSVQSYDKGGCRDLEHCNLCHGWKELEYHPLNYKTKPCNAANCRKKDRECAYYHRENEKRIKIPMRKSSLWTIEEPQQQFQKIQQDKKIPYGKQQSNFNGPIIPNVQPSENDYFISRIVDEEEIRDRVALRTIYFIFTFEYSSLRLQKNVRYLSRILNHFNANLSEKGSNSISPEKNQNCSGHPRLTNIMPLGIS